VVNFELPNVEEDYVHRIGRTGRAGRSGEAISLVAPDEEKLLKSIERVTRQKIPDGDLMGFDASQVEAEKPEVRERQPNNGRGGRNQQARGDAGKEGSGGRKDKGKDKGKSKPAAEKPADKEKSGDKPQQGQQRKPRDKKPRQQQAAQGQNAAPKPAADRDPEEFLDDDVDNFGNRADYVSPYQNAKNGRNRRPGGNGGQQGQGQRSGGGQGQGQGRGNGGQQRQGQGSGEKRVRNGGGSNGGGARRDNNAGRNRRDDTARQEPAVRNPRDSQPAPVIIRKESKLDRYPTPEQLDDLPSRPRGERPALLTRKG
jgi:ATP-dependent RNA helicase RhlE